jgi:hypothetical protein
MAATRAQSGFPCSGKCGCFTERLVEDLAQPGKQIALCVWCEDGEDCPNKPAKPDSPAPPPPRRRRGKTAAQADQQTAERLARIEKAAAEQPTSNASPEKKTRKQTMLPTTPCQAPGCGKQTRSKVGYCAKHFYMSLKTSATVGKKSLAPKAVNNTRAKDVLSKANGHDHAAAATTNGHAAPQVMLELTEDELNGFILRMPLARKIDLVKFFIRPTPQSGTAA